MRRLMSTVSVLFILACGSASSQSASVEYPCESPEVRTAFETTLSQDELVKLPTEQRRQRIGEMLDALIAKYPHDYLLYREQINSVFFQTDATAAFDALRDYWAKEAKSHPDDPMVLTVTARTVIDKDPAKAIELLNIAKETAPNFPWPFSELAGIYWRGKYGNEAKMKENLERFYTLCPAWVSETYIGNQIEGFKLRSDLPLVTKTATALREGLAKQTDPKRLEDYQILWQREFLTRPPAEHDAERAEIREDLGHLEKLVSNGDGNWRLFLISGHKLAGASNEGLAHMQQQAAKDFPHQAPAEQWDREQWQKDHPQPDGQKDAAAWKSYYAADVEHIKKLLADYPDDAFLQRSEFFATVQDDDYVSEADGLAAVNRYQDAMHTYGGYAILSFSPRDVPRFLLRHGWEPGRALELLKETSTYKDGGHSREQWSDSLDADTVKLFHRQIVSEDLETMGLILKAAQLAGKPEEGMRFRAVIEGPPPENEKDLAQYWMNRARFAELDHHAADALVYYRTALDDRTEPPVYSHGLLRDDLTDEFHALWLRQGGTETAWTVWNAPPTSENPTAVQPSAEAANGSTTAVAKAIPPQPAGGQSAAAPKKGVKKAALQESDWEKVTEKMAAIDLADFSGKRWHHKDLAGKTVVIVSWATWCGPCRLQDAQLEKFYVKMKDRKDLTILGLNVDENPGEVRPFMQQHGYTFPVLAGSSYKQALGLVPRTWIIDKQGNWRWVRNGFNEEKSYSDFETDLLGQIAKVSAGQ